MNECTRTFQTEDQERFAALSGDRNPLHLDPIFARRTPFGRPIVHGLHLVMWALERLCAAEALAFRAAGLKVDFLEPCLVGEAVTLQTIDRPAATPLIQLKSGSALLAQFTVLREALPLPGESIGARRGSLDEIPIHPRRLTVEQIEANEGHLRYEGRGLAAAFPSASATLGARAVVGLVALSTVVGMLCPGLYSLFAGFTATFVETGDDALCYRVCRMYESVRQVLIRVRVQGVEANVRAGARLPPVAQIGFAEARSLVSVNRFEGCHALVVGGSRGLGELTAKIIAAGGGHTLITYASGKDDADAVADEICREGGKCTTCHYDVVEGPQTQFKQLALGLTSMYFFATVPIFRTKKSIYDATLLQEFMSVYVAAFSRLCEMLSNADRLRVFFPSSVALNAPVKDLYEYSAAKMAGELMCDHLALRFRNLSFVVSRLPRIMTDQTATIIPVQTANALETILPIIEEVERVRPTL